MGRKEKREGNNEAKDRCEKQELGRTTCEFEKSNQG